MHSYFFIIQNCRKSDLARLLGSVKRGYIHTFTHDTRTMIRVTGDVQTALSVHYAMSIYASVGALKRIGGMEIIGVGPVLVEKRGKAERLHLPEKPKDYRPFRMADMPWYADLMRRN